MFVGYALNHPGDCYRMWDPETGGIRESRDVIWMKRMFFTKKSKAISAMEDEDNTEADIDIDYVAEVKENTDPVASVEAGEGNTPAVGEKDGDEDTDDDKNEKEIPPMTRTGRTVKPPARLIEEMGASGYEIMLTAAEQNYYAAMRSFPEGEFRKGEFAWEERENRCKCIFNVILKMIYDFVGVTADISKTYRIPIQKLKIPDRKQQKSRQQCLIYFCSLPFT
jgi:hypothetical protein